MTELTQGQRSAAVRLWNKHLDLNAVARQMRGVDFELLRGFLESYPAYPGKIRSIRAAQAKAHAAGLKLSDIDGELAQRATPSLPRLKFLEGKDT